MTPHWLCHTGISSLIVAYRMASRVGDESNFWIYDLSDHAWDPRDYVTLWFPSSGTLVTQTCLRVLWPLASAGKGMYRVIFFRPKHFCCQKPSVHSVPYLPQSQYIWQTSGCVVKPDPVVLLTRTDNGGSISNEIALGANKVWKFVIPCYWYEG